MRQPRAALDGRRAQEFDSFVAGAAGRLLHAAVLLTGEPPDAAPQAGRLLTAAFAVVYADWDRLRGDDPYDRARLELTARYARASLRRLGRAGPLAPLGRTERLVVVLRLYEGAGEEQTAALTGLPVERVRELCTGAIAAVRRARARRPRPRPAARPGSGRSRAAVP